MIEVAAWWGEKILIAAVLWMFVVVPVLVFNRGKSN